MNRYRLLGGALALAMLAVAGAASANDLGEDGAWQFRNPAQTQTLQNGILLMQENRNHTLGAAASATGTSGTGSLFGASSTGYNNFTQIVNETTNNCQASGAGAVLTCGGGSNSGVVSQTANQSPVSSSNTLTGNTLTDTTTTTTSHSNNGNH